MLSLELLPAGNGDCLWIEYGHPREVRRVLIDGGTAPTYRVLRKRLLALPEADRRLELLVITHIDGDHIDGARLARDGGLGVSYGDVWFNAWKHLVARDELGPVAGERLSETIHERGLPWNRAFDGGAVRADAMAAGLPTVELEGGLRLTVLSPFRRQLVDLIDVWEKVVRKAGLTPGGAEVDPGAVEMSEPADLLGSGIDIDKLAGAPFVEDHSEANGSSIALLAEYEGRRLLLTADAFPSVLETSLAQLTGGSSLAVDAVKLNHHGSRRSVSPELVRRIDARHYLVSTNGEKHHHPDPEAIARLLVRNRDGDGTELHFNYRTAETAIWEDPDLQALHNYSTVYPQAEGDPARVNWA